MRMVAAKHAADDLITNQRDTVEIEAQRELERVFYTRGILVENVLLSEIETVLHKS